MGIPTINQIYLVQADGEDRMPGAIAAMLGGVSTDDAPITGPIDIGADEEWLFWAIAARSDAAHDIGQPAEMRLILEDALTRTRAVREAWERQMAEGQAQVAEQLGEPAEGPEVPVDSGRTIVLTVTTNPEHPEYADRVMDILRVVRSGFMEPHMVGEDDLGWDFSGPYEVSAFDKHMLDAIADEYEYRTEVDADEPHVIAGKAVLSAARDAVAQAFNEPLPAPSAG